MSRLTMDLAAGITVEAILRTPPATSIKNTLAILLHPWSWLGGQMGDPVLSLLVDTLSRRGYHTIQYNSRGVGGSTGWSSLSGLSEGEDLCALVNWATKKLDVEFERLTLVGYSHGSLIATLCPPRSSPIPVSYILLSYPAGPRAFLTLFHSSTYDKALETIVASGSRVLIVYGTGDEFTGVKRYEDWTGKFHERENVHVARVEDGGHFWRDPTAVRDLKTAVGDWLRE